MFRLDPVELLKAPPFEWALRIAAYRVVARDNRKAEPPTG